MALIDPSILDSLGFMFNKTCTIQRESETQDSAGQPIPTWVPLEYSFETDEGGEIITSDGEPILTSLVHQDLACVVQPAKSGRSAEVRKPDRTYVVAPYKILLQGYYPAINETMRAVVGLQTHDILLVQHDSQNIITTLFTEIIS